MISNEERRAAMRRLVREMRPMLELFARDRHRTVIGTCPDCGHEISDNDRSAHHCPPKVGAS